MTTDAERLLHERVAALDSHADQQRGIVGWFYRHYVEEARRFVGECRGEVLDVGAGEGVMFAPADPVVQLDC
jgi:hypothetical protein